MRRNTHFWGRLVETAVGAHLVNSASGTSLEVFYWRDRNREVDYVVRSGGSVAAVEVKSGRSPETLPGMAAFARAFGPARQILVGEDGIGLAEFLSRPASA